MQEKQISRGQIRRITKNTGAEEIAEIVNEVKDGDVIEFEKAVYTLGGAFATKKISGFRITTTAKKR
mgnify:CR=1 FL=1